jgi:hypothetical protein
MRGSGTLYRQPASRFWWMQYFHRGQRFRRSMGCDRVKDAQDVLRKTLVDIEQQEMDLGRMFRRLRQERSNHKTGSYVRDLKLLRVSP